MQFCLGVMFFQLNLQNLYINLVLVYGNSTKVIGIDFVVGVKAKHICNLINCGILGGIIAFRLKDILIR